MLRFLLIFTLLLFASIGYGQKLAERQVLKLRAEVTSDPATIQLLWPSTGAANQFNVYRRVSLDSMYWGNPIATLSGSSTSFTDTSVLVGEDYEYQVVQTGAQNATGYLYSGIRKSAVHHPEGVILLIDKTYEQALAPEIEQLENDFRQEGRHVISLYVNRSESPRDIRDKIQGTVFSSRIWMSHLFILGHVPVPYSGDFGGTYPPPDGHIVGSGSHTGAWVADSYYGDLDQIWQDQVVNNTTGKQNRNHNIPGDGKFDPTKIPFAIELKIGRVDLYDLPAFGMSDTLLLKRYLQRNHLWRTGQWQVTERAVIDNNFNGLNLASTGWHNFTASLPWDSVKTGDYFSAQKTGSYLWSFGCGAGSYTSCNGVGTTSDFASDSLQNVFTILSGSYFGDWDVTDNLLRAPLANSALASFWGGIPKWYVHTMALGETIGQGARATTNNSSVYFNGQFNLSHHSTHISLMGDPTLKMRYYQGPTGLMANAINNQVLLSWTPGKDSVEGYHIYRIDSATGVLNLLNTTPISGTSFTDSTLTESNTVHYLVRGVRLETTPSGSYYNLSAGSRTSVQFDFIHSVSDPLVGQTFWLFPNPTKSGEFVLEMGIDRATTWTLSLLDLNGKKCHEQQFRTQVGMNSFRVQSHLSPGVYLVRFEDAYGAAAMRRLVVTGN
ncbi:T9SS type A sorting domain-containing protein [bacterium SCSIO 12741]|nr:T9SS type A sorting domain-containing protein [bacterium SCSIO 12741]